MSGSRLSLNRSDRKRVVCNIAVLVNGLLPLSSQGMAPGGVKKVPRDVVNVNRLSLVIDISTCCPEDIPLRSRRRPADALSG